jgi:hypothetical protein
MRFLITLCLAWLVWVTIAFLVLTSRPADQQIVIDEPDLYRAAGQWCDVPTTPLLRSPRNRVDKRLDPRAFNDKGIA